MEAASDEPQSADVVGVDDDGGESIFHASVMLQAGNRAVLQRPWAEQDRAMTGLQIQGERATALHGAATGQTGGDAKTGVIVIAECEGLADCVHTNSPEEIVAVVSCLTRAQSDAAARFDRCTVLRCDDSVFLAIIDAEPVATAFAWALNLGKRLQGAVDETNDIHEVALRARLFVTRGSVTPIGSDWTGPPIVEALCEVLRGDASQIQVSAALHLASDGAKFPTKVVDGRTYAVDQA